MQPRREGIRTGPALAVSLVLHAAAVGAMMASSGPPRPPAEKVIAVDIVSPPPNVAGSPMAEPPATQEPAPAAPAQAQPQPAQPEPAPPEPAPPAPRPEPRREAPKEPDKAPEPKREPERPAQRPPAQRPPTPRPQAQTPARPARTEPEKGTRPGQGTQADRTEGQGTRTGPATGSNARPDAAGGEGITVRTDGDPCPVQGYCENVTRQVRRFFRPPAQTGTATGEVCFRIQRDGSVTDIEARRVRGGGAAFRIAMSEAAEAAGSRRAFGALPSAFDPARWRWCVELSPS